MSSTRLAARAVLEALADALSEADVAHAAVEAEALRCAHPALSSEQEMRHLAAICALFRDAGHHLLLIGQTIETDDDLAQLLAAVGADEHLLVRLEAQPSTLKSSPRPCPPSTTSTWS